MKEFINRYKFYILIFFLAVIPLYSLFSQQLLFTQDGYTHLVRGAAYFKALSNFEIPPRWAGELNYGYGMPLFIFVFQLPYQLFSLLIAFGFSLSNAFRILIFASYFLSGVTMFLFSKKFFKDTKTAFLVTMLYQFFPYRFVDLIIRGSIGEAFTFVFLPLVLYGILELNEKKSIRGLVIVILGTSSLLLSHLATGGVFIGLAILFNIFFSRNLKKFIIANLSIVFGFLVAAYYVIPAIIEHKYTYGDLFVKDLFKENIVPFEKLFSISPINNQWVRMGDVPVNLGLSHLLIFGFLLFAVISYKKFKKRDKKLIGFIAIVTFSSMIMMLTISRPIWENVTLLRQFQFPWRFLAPIGFALALTGGLLGVYLKSKKVFVFGILLIVLISMPFWIPALGYKKVDEKYYWNFPLTTTYFGETDIIWSAGPAKDYPKSRVEFTKGNGNITSFVSNNSSQKFLIFSEEESEMVSHTQYFPGWVVRIDGSKTPIQFQDQNHRGEILFTVPAGSHSIEIKFEESKIRFVSNILTFLSLVLLFPFVFIIKKYL
ncbi:MAG: 6-pyruvoyl-tetrahydropterin synthase-related protein [Candidatus Levybacteria bacterium]|nr:6-pyruvoyl-tetrahydropterin synthase-related protein [Candidatus Levybacteria bacterium]